MVKLRKRYNTRVSLDITKIKNTSHHITIYKCTEGDKSRELFLSNI